jgi:O-acetylserine/cysteine efflux transporter
LSWLLEDGQAEALANAGALPWGAVVYNAIAVSVFGHGGVYYLVQRYPVGLVSTLALLAPVMSIGFALWLWHDELTWRLAIGAVMTLLGVTVISLRGRRKEAEA